MALLNTATPAADTSSKNSRGYATRATALRPNTIGWPRRRSPRAGHQNVYQTLYYGCKFWEVNRLYHKLITSWWRTGNTNQPKAWWTALAAANPLTNVRGKVYTATGFQFFVWYQRQLLDYDQLTHIAFNPNPTPRVDYLRTTPIPMPAAPTLPWAPPPAYAIVAASGTSGIQLTIQTANLPAGTRLSGNFWVSTYPPGPNARWNPSRLEAQPFRADGNFNPQIFGVVTFAYLPTMPPGRVTRIFCGQIDATTLQPSPLSSFDATWT